MTYVWGAFAEKQLREMWVEQGCTCVAIAKAFGISKSAVLGKLRRLKLTPRPHVARVAPAPPRPPSTPRGPRPPLVLTTSPNRRCQWLARRWTKADGAAPPICGGDAVVGHSWCVEHYSRVFQPKGTPADVAA